MCGQGGFAGSLTHTEERAFQHLLLYNGSRGLDSTGAASIKRSETNGKPDIVLVKELGSIYELLSIARKGEKSFSDVTAGTQRALLGHCRAKTIGPQARRNAHPFKFDNIIGTHNGTLSHSTHSKLAGYTKYDTDSQALYAEINDKGIAEVVRMLRRSPSINTSHPDAYALVWYNVEENSINFLRNKERPLWLGFSKDMTKLGWSSEIGHLYAAMHGGGIPHEDKFLICLPEDTHVSYTIPAVGQKFGKPRVIKREGTPDPLAPATGSVLGAYHGKNNKSCEHGQARTATTYNPGNYNGPEPWFDDTNNFWVRWLPGKIGYQYARIKQGIFYNSLQEAWDMLTDSEQKARLAEGKNPPCIVSPTKRVCEIPRANLGTHPDLLDAKAAEAQTALMKRKALTEQCQEKRFLSCTEKPKFPLIHKEQGKKVYWDHEQKKYRYWSFQGFNQPYEKSWKQEVLDLCPEFVPFMKLDIDARHCFEHKGKGPKKVVYYKGFNKTMLVQASFEKIMKDGCLSCGRSPEWGNFVHFVDYNYFFCEHCARNQELVDSFKTGTRH